ncbi:hypothetical protein MLD38_028173 [Melastoma candidum]|uniref:Uncharacterized protein n=2 Tax=Melastoma candidum TaxID=119954 RepID=A0ACB9N027_9MYRT|nr:hypothetical protein MLD38_028169 [Melastoma candidum]KAI4329830.1 hypothetical protein MLD38_028173 [Melastoma candidum]
MAIRGFLMAMAIGVLFLASFASSVDTRVSSKVCSPDKYQGDSAYANSVATVLNDMMTTTANSPGYERSTKAGNIDSRVFGHSTCRESLSTSDCNLCMGVVESLIQGNCPMSFTAKLETPDCTMEYRN